AAPKLYVAISDEGLASRALRYSISASVYFLSLNNPFPFLIVLRSTFSSILFSPCATACAFSCASKLIVMLINTKYIIYLIDFISQHIYEKKVIFFNQLFFLSTINTSTINNNNAIHASP